MLLLRVTATLLTRRNLAVRTIVSAVQKISTVAGASHCSS
jgi:hypothetical protein